MQIYLLFLSYQHEPHEGRDHLGLVLTLSPFLESTWLKTEEPRARGKKKMAKLRFEPTCTQNSIWGLVIQTPEYLHRSQLGRIWNHLEDKPLGMFEGIFSRAN